MEEEIVIDYELFDEINKDGPCIIFNQEKSDRLGKPCYSVKKFSQIQPDMEVHIAQFEGCAENKDCFYYCLPCLKNPRDYVTYKDGTIVSVRWKIDKRLAHKGFHGKSFVVPIVDMFVDGRSICVRFYKNSIHIAGKMPRGVKTIEKTCQLAEQILQEAYNFWYNCQNNADLFWEATYWLAKISSTKENEVFVHEADGSKRTDYSLIWPGFAPPEYEYFVTEIIERYTDVHYVSKLLQRTEEILACQNPPVAEECQFLEFGTSLVRCKYEIGFPVDVPELVQLLKGMDYQVTNHDTTKSNLKLQIVDYNSYPDDYKINRKKGKIHTQSLSFSKKGTIQHSGTGHRRHEEAYKNLMRDIILLYAE